MTGAHDEAHARLDENDGIATLMLARPAKLNALSSRSLTQVIGHLDAVRDRGTARALLLTGEGRAFCTGADLTAEDVTSGPDVDRGEWLERGFNPLVERLAALPIPIVVAANGAVAGGGVGLALAGDIVLMARSGYFLMPFASIGLVPDVGATWLLPRLIGQARATAMMMLGERVPADTAADWGLIWRAVDDDRLAEAAHAVARRLADGATVALGLMRRALREAATASLTETLAAERRDQLIAGRTADHAEGLAAFVERRPPRFAGR